MDGLLSRVIEGGSFVYPWNLNSEDRIHVLKRLLTNPEHVLRTEPEVFSKVMSYEDAEVITACLPYVPDVNAPLNENELTALHLSVKRGLEEVASKLLELGARTECGTKSLKHTPLHIAANKGNRKMIDLLLRHRADVNATDGMKNTPLFSICNSQCSDISVYRCIKSLLESGAEVNIHNSSKHTPLMVSIMNRWNPGKFDYICHLLLKAGADPNLAKPDDGNTPLHYLASGGGEETDILAVAELLLNKGACINRTNNQGDPPLHSAFSSRRWFLVDYLVENGADLNILIENGTNANLLSLRLSVLGEFPSAYNLATSYSLNQQCIGGSTEELLLISHIALKIVNESHVCEKAISCIDRQQSLKQFMANCIEQANALKARSIEGSNLTFCDIVHSDRRKISEYMKNNNVISALETDYESFPIYGRCLKRRMDQILRRQKDENSTLNIISDIFDFVPLNSLEQIVEQFSSTERKMLMEAFKNDLFSDFSISDMLDLM